jgi:membrane protein implicated in regulation of membrane protease activity
MSNRKRLRASKKAMLAVVLCLFLALTPGCQVSAAQIYIPLGYGLTGLCVALLMSPTPTAAVVGFIAGALLGAAVYNNSLKRQIEEPARTGPDSVNP